MCSVRYEARVGEGQLTQSEGVWRSLWKAGRRKEGWKGWKKWGRERGGERQGETQATCGKEKWWAMGKLKLLRGPDVQVNSVRFRFTKEAVKIDWGRIFTDLEGSLQTLRSHRQCCGRFWMILWHKTIVLITVGWWTYYFSDFLFTVPFDF